MRDRFNTGGWLIAREYGNWVWVLLGSFSVYRYGSEAVERWDPDDAVVAVAFVLASAFILTFALDRLTAALERRRDRALLRLRSM